MKKEIRNDILTQTEKLTGIPIWEIMNAARLANGLSYRDFDNMYFFYYQQNKIAKELKKFALFLNNEWKEENES
ncbi:MAG: hypothetical protein WC878_00235 [Candidatus Paceibacterota bacterium]|jgi:hypothetical protein